MGKQRSDIFKKIDDAVILAIQREESYGLRANVLSFDKPRSAAVEVHNIVVLLAEVREPLNGTMFLRLKEETRILLIQQSIRKLVRQGRLTGYDIQVPVLVRDGGNVLHLMRKVRRYRLSTPLDSLARL